MTTPVGIDLTATALSTGSNDVTAYTGNANRRTRVKSLLATYTGTVAGVSLQLVANGEPVGLPVGGLTSAQPVQLVTPGQAPLLDPEEALTVRVAGATAADTLAAEGQAEEVLA